MARSLPSWRSVVTLGSAAIRPSAAILEVIRVAPKLFIATDADDAGDQAAAAWIDRARQVKPPTAKDWTGAFRAGVNLRRFWSEVINGQA